MAESNQKHMKPSWATGQTVSIREESIIDNGSFLGGQFSCALTSSSSVTFTQVLAAGSSDAPRHYNNDYGYIATVNACNREEARQRNKDLLQQFGGKKRHPLRVL